MLIIFILSHGTYDGKIFTVYENEYFTTTEVLTNLRSLQSFKTSLKLVFFGVSKNSSPSYIKTYNVYISNLQPCRGSNVEKAFTEKSPALDVKGNENSCRVSSIPNEDNFIIVFATVESKHQLKENNCSLLQCI